MRVVRRDEEGRLRVRVVRRDEEGRLRVSG